MTIASNKLKTVGPAYRVEKETDRPLRRVLKRIKQIFVVFLAAMFVLLAATQIYFYSGSEEYNYERFNANSSRIEYGVLPAGQAVPDATLFNVNSGEFVEFSELWQEKPIVVEMGSISCFYFTTKMVDMKTLQTRYGNEVDFYILYGREAHPGSIYTAHGSFEQKISYATDLVELDHPGRDVLVDDIAGSLHRQFGALSNAVYLIGTDGIVAHRAKWNDVEVLTQEIDKLLAHDDLAGGYAAYTDLDNQPQFESPTLGEEIFRITQRAGSGSLFDLLIYIPTIIARQFTS